ncbi:transposable element Tcb1 transposase [Trichonephila clavipes]|nr:transposable element Tcb1 transposase [Trichonephila clavipes]
MVVIGLTSYSVQSCFIVEADDNRLRVWKGRGQRSQSPFVLQKHAAITPGRPRVITPNEDRYLAVAAKRNRRSTSSDLSRQFSSATGTTVSRQTVYRRLGHIGLYARRPSRFSLQSDSRQTLIWRAPGTRYHQENTIERHRYGGAGWLVWGGIILGSRTDLHVQSVRMTSHIYRNVILKQHVRLFRGAMGAEFLFMDG